MPRISKKEKRYKKKFLNNQGISLIELVVFIVVSGIISIGLIGVYQSFLNESTTPETLAQAKFLGQQKMEEITKQSFVDPNFIIEEIAYTSAPISGYEWYWKIEYIDGNSLAYSATSTMFKKITVKVRDQRGIELEFYTIVTKRYWDAPVG